QVVGVGLALPGVNRDDDLVNGVSSGADPVDPAARIGRKGLRYKDRATQLALTAAKEGLSDAGLIEDGRENCPLGSTTAVVASSNLGNLDTVCRSAATINDESVESLSPMALPNASSNVIASSVAIRFALKGPNLMVCNGPTSGLDALFWAASLIRAGRADRAVVVGAEVGNPVTAALTGHPVEDLLDGAVSVILESAASAELRQVPALAELGTHTRQSTVAACVDHLTEAARTRAPSEIWLTPEGFEGPAGAGHGLPRHDLTSAFGRASGALGVLQCAAATNWLNSNGPGPVLLTNGHDGSDGVVGMLMESARAA